MSNVANTISPSATLNNLPERIFTVDPKVCARDFEQKAFLMDHSIVSDPASMMTRVQNLLERSLAIPGKVYWNAGKRSVGQKWSDRPGRDFPIEEAFRRIRESDAWIEIYGADRDPEIHELLERGFAEISEMTGIDLKREAKTSQSLFFITSPHRVTEFHIDRQCSLLLQMHGTKTIHVYDKTDREVLPEEELERFWSVDNNAATYRPELQHHATSFLLEPGKAVHIPVNAPHWLQNGDDISVSLNLNFEFKNEKLGNIYRANHCLRKMGLSPLPPGKSILVDKVKAHGMRFPVFAAKHVVEIKEKLANRRSKTE